MQDFKTEDDAERVGWLLFHLRASITAVVAFSELAIEKAEPSHPAFAELQTVQQQGKRALDVMQQFQQIDRAIRQKRKEA